MTEERMALLELVEKTADASRLPRRLVYHLTPGSLPTTDAGAGEASRTTPGGPPARCAVGTPCLVRRSVHKPREETNNAH